MLSIKQTPRQLLRQAVQSTYTVGIAFLLASFVPAAFLASTRRIGFLDELLVFTTTVTLVGPGVWYIVSAYFMNKLELWPIRISFRVAAAQATIVGAGLIVQVLDRRRFLFIPAVLAIFFLPALVALIFELLRARAAIQILQPMGRAFQPVNAKLPDAPQPSNLTNLKAEPNPTNPQD